MPQTFLFYKLPKLQRI